MGITGQRMRLARTEAGLNSKTAARELGMGPSELSRVEHGDPRARKLNEVELVTASRLYNRSVDWLLGLSDVPTLRADLAWRLAELPDEILLMMVERPVYLLHEFLEQHGLLKTQQKKRSITSMEPDH